MHKIQKDVIFNTFPACKNKLTKIKNSHFAWQDPKLVTLATNYTHISEA